MRFAESPKGIRSTHELLIVLRDNYKKSNIGFCSFVQYLYLTRKINYHEMIDLEEYLLANTPTHVLKKVLKEKRKRRKQNYRDVEKELYLRRYFFWWNSDDYMVRIDWLNEQIL